MRGVADAVQTPVNEYMTNDPMAHLYAVILAGGSGARFWPLSREMTPKQLLAIFGGHSLIVQAITRALPFTAGRPASVRIVTNERLARAIDAHLDEQGATFRALTACTMEPVSRNTAPAIALIAAELAALDPDAIMLVLPSDQIVRADQVWADVVHSAVRLAADGYLVTVGLRPRYPETGYGYVAGGEALPAYAIGDIRPALASRFIEKPPYEQACALVAAGTYYWNAGIFCLRAQQVLDELAALDAPHRRIAETCRWMAAIPKARWFDDAVRARFVALPSISLDKALLERSARVAVIPAALEWRDVGSLQSLATLGTPDAEGNVRVGRGVDIDTRDTLVYTSNRLVATLGVRDLLVVDTADATLVCHKDRGQDVRLIVEALKAQGADELIEASTSLRPWGCWTTLQRGPGFLIRLVEVYPGGKTTVHRHRQHSEHWVVIAGTASVWRGDTCTDIAVNESLFMPAEAVHCLENRTTAPLKLIEVHVGAVLGDEDIIRLAAPPEA